jgi:hypothetical protein
MPTARCCSCRSRAPALPDRVRHHRHRARRDRGHPARREDPRRTHVDGPARGYVCENYGGAFTLPERGPIGANCLANPRDFLTPVAAYEDRDAPTDVREVGRRAVHDELGHSPLDVVAWHGNYAPYKYDLRHFRRSARSCSTIPIRRSSRC